MTDRDAEHSQRQSTTAGKAEKPPTEREESRFRPLLLATFGLLCIALLGLHIVILTHDIIPEARSTFDLTSMLVMPGALIALAYPLWWRPLSKRLAKGVLMDLLYLPLGFAIFVAYVFGAFIVYEINGQADLMPTESLYRAYHYPSCDKSVYVYRDAFVSLSGEARYIIKERTSPLPFMETVRETDELPFWIPPEIEAHLDAARGACGDVIETYNRGWLEDREPPGPRPERIELGEGVALELSQSSAEAVPGSDQWLTIQIGDVTRSQTSLLIRDAEGFVLLGPTSVADGDTRFFAFDDERFSVTVQIVDDTWSDDDGAIVSFEPADR